MRKPFCCAVAHGRVTAVMTEYIFLPCSAPIRFIRSVRDLRSSLFPFSIHHPFRRSSHVTQPKNTKSAQTHRTGLCIGATDRIKSFHSNRAYLFVFSGEWQPFYSRHTYQWDVVICTVDGEQRPRDRMPINLFWLENCLHSTIKAIQYRTEM